MVLGITNCREEDIENVNVQIKKIQERIGEENLHIFIFHDEDYNKCKSKYENFINLVFQSENKNKGTLYGRIKVINMIPAELDNEYLVWLDSDDYIDIDILLACIEKFKDYDYKTPFINAKCLWWKLARVGVYKEAIRTIRQYPGLRMRLAECNIITAGLIDLCNRKKITCVCTGDGEYRYNWISYGGGYQSFDISKNFDDTRIDNLRADLEDLAQWIIWREIDKPGFDLDADSCSHVYFDSMRNLRTLDKDRDKKIINRINELVEDITKDMPDNYKSVIRSKLIIR